MSDKIRRIRQTPMSELTDSEVLDYMEQDRGPFVAVDGTGQEVSFTREEGWRFGGNKREPRTTTADKLRKLKEECGWSYSDL